jgi:hypothetical protein
MEMPKMEFNLQSLVNYIIVIICLIGSLLLGFFVAWPQYRSYRDLQPVLTDTESKSEQLNAFVKYLQNLSDFQDRLFANMGLSKQAIPETEEAPFFLDQIVQIAEKANVAIDTLTFGGLSAPAKSKVNEDVESGTAFKRFQADPGEEIDNKSSTAEVDQFIDKAIPGNQQSPNAKSSMPTLIPAEEFYVKLVFLGTYQTTRDFLSDLEKARRLVAVKEIEVKEYDFDLKNAGSSDSDKTTVQYIKNLTSAGLFTDGVLYKTSLLMSGYYMADPEVTVVGPEILNTQRNFDTAISDLESLNYYEPQSQEEIELNIGRLNPFDLTVDGLEVSGTEDELAQ